MEYNKGDIVVVTRQYSSNNSKNGDIVILVDFDNGRIPYQVTNRNYSPSWCIEIRKASNREILAYEEGILNITQIPEPIEVLESQIIENYNIY